MQILSGAPLGAIELVLEYHASSRENHMQIETTKKLFTVDEYYRMADAGILAPEDRVELIDGEIIEMSPIGDRHAGCVNRANRLFTSALGNRVVVSVQPIALPEVIFTVEQLLV